MFKQLLNQCTIVMRLEAQEPLLVKSGAAVVSGPDMAFVRTSRNGRFEPFLPGSSLKGVIRSHAERIARTLRSRSVCDVFDRHVRVQGCGTRLADTRTPADYRDACPACRLFGSLRWKGRFNVGDGYLAAGYELVQPEQRDGIGIDRVSGGVAGGAKFDMEVIPAGTQFVTRLDVVNFELWQLGWVAYVLRDLAEGYLQVGMGTSRGLGRVGGHLDTLVLSYVGAPEGLRDRLPGIGGLVGAEERAAYGLGSDDHVPLPAGVVFERGRGALRSEVRRQGTAEILEMLANVAPAWDRYIVTRPALA